MNLTMNVENTTPEAVVAKTASVKDRKLMTFAVREVEKLKTTAVAFYVPIICGNLPPV